MSYEDKIINRVKKMLAIANCSGATEAERDTALQMAYKVLAAHNLSMVDVDQHSADKQDPRDMHGADGYGMPWAKAVANDISKMFFAKFFGGAKINAWKTKWHFVGRESNATTAMHMSVFVVEALIKEVRSRYGSDSSPEARSFCIGAANKIHDRVKEIMAQQAQEQESSGRDLVLASLYKRELDANLLLLESKGISLRPANSGKRTANAQAYEAGQAHGSKIGLSPQVGASAPNTRRLK